MSIFDWGTTIGEDTKPSQSSGSIFNWEKPTVQKAVDSLPPEPTPKKSGFLNTLGKIGSFLFNPSLPKSIQSALDLLPQPKVKPGSVMDFPVISSPLNDTNANKLVDDLNTRGDTLLNKSKNLDLSDEDAINSYNAEVSQFQKDSQAAGPQISQFNMAQKAHEVLTTPSGREALGLSQEHQLEKGVGLVLLAGGLIASGGEGAILLDTVAGAKLVPMITKALVQGSIGLGTFAALDKATAGLKENATDNQRLLLFMGELFAAGGILHGLNKAVPKIGDKLFQTYSEKYNAPKTIYFKGDEIPQKIATVPESAEHKALIEALSKDGHVDKTKASEAMKNGITIEVPASVIKSVAETPLWTKVKKAFGLETGASEGAQTFGAGKRAPQEHNLLEAPTKESLQSLATKVAQEKMSFKVSTPEIPEDLKPLAMEAKKYKSYEKFVKAQAEIPLHPESAKAPVNEVPAVGSTIKTKLSDAEYKVVAVNADRLTVQRKGSTSTFTVGMHEVTQVLKGKMQPYKALPPTADALKLAETRQEGILRENDFASLNDFYNHVHGLDSKGKPIENTGYGERQNRALQKNSKGTGNGSMGRVEGMARLSDRGSVEEGTGATNFRTNGNGDQLDTRSEKRLSKGDTVDLKDSTFQVLRDSDVPPELTNKLEIAHQKGGVTKIAFRSEMEHNGKMVPIDAVYGDDTLYLNFGLTKSPSYKSGAIIDHEINGHSWYIKLPAEDRKVFFENLKTSKETLKQSWQDVKLDHTFYWENTLSQISEQISLINSQAVADQIMEFAGLKYDPDISLDTFINKSLNLDKTIEAINAELVRRGQDTIPLKAEDTVAGREHNAVIAENSSKLTPNETSIIGRYIGDIQSQTLTFGENGLNNLIYPGETDLSIKTLEKLKGRDFVSKQFISDMTNSGDIKQVERDILRDVLAQYPDDAKIPVKEFAEKVKIELLPLTIEDVTEGPMGGPRYESVSLPDDVRGDVSNYAEHIFSSPIKTSAGQVHFGGDAENYFGHTRIEDMDSSNNTYHPKTNKLITGNEEIRRVIEVQSDLYQKGNLERERGHFEMLPRADENYNDYAKRLGDKALSISELSSMRDKELAKLQQYNDPTAHFRMVREEIKKAAEDGKTKLQFPTGSTAMQIEGLGDNTFFDDIETEMSLTPESLKVGKEITYRDQYDDPNSRFIITEVLGDGKFKAVPKTNMEAYEKDLAKIQEPYNASVRNELLRNNQNRLDNSTETFDVSGNLDTNNPIYRFYEKDLGRYLKNQYDAKPVTDENGVTWNEVAIKPEMAEQPVMVFRVSDKNPEFNSGDKMDDVRKALEHAEKRMGVKPVDIGKLENQLNRVQESLKAAEAQPEAHKKAYGEDKMPEYKAKIESIKQRIVKGNQMNTIINAGKLSPEELKTILEPSKIKAEKARSTPTSKIPLPPKIEQQGNEIAQLSALIEHKTETLNSHPGQRLQKFISRREGQFMDLKDPDTGNTPKERLAIYERNQKILKEAESALEGTEFTERFSDPEVIRELIDDYKLQKEQLNNLRQERIELKKKFYKDRNLFWSEERDRIAVNNLVSKEERVKVLNEVEKRIRKEGQDRRKKVEAIRDYFYLTQKEINQLSDFTDYRLLSDKEFDAFLEKVQEKAYEVAKHTEAVAEVEYTITQKNLKLTENLQEAIGLSRNLKDLTTDQLNKLNDLLGYFEDDDVFLGTREIQTLAKNTDLPQVKTQRQIIRALFPNLPMDQLRAITAKWTDYIQSATSLSQNDPLKEWMVLNLRELMIEEQEHYRQVEKEVNELAKNARASRKRSMLDRLVPTDRIVREYLEEGDPATKAAIAATMTAPELKFAHYLREGWLEKRDYLVKQEVLQRYIENYATHRKRGFLEAWLKNDTQMPGKFNWIRGFGRAVKETFWDAHKLDQASFTILDNKTGIILPLEKWFRYAMKRSGNLIPTNNMALAYLGYEKTFGVKKVLDAYMPKMEAVARALAPTETTDKGLVKDERLLNFVKEFINTQKGRPMAYGPLLTPGNGLDIILRMGVALVRYKALAFNFASQLTSPIGEQYATFIQQGAKKYARGVIRARTSQGKMLVKKHEAFVGETLWERLRNQSRDIGSRFGELAFGGFSIASRQANLVHFLGELTPEEFKSGEISSKRLAQIKNEMGRWRAEEQLSGIAAKTSIGGVLRQFRSWAIPIATQTVKNINKLIGMTKKEGFKSAFKSKEFAEVFRATVPLILLLWAVHGTYNSLKNKKNRSFSEQLSYKIMQEIGSSLSALAPSTFLSPAPLYNWLSTVGKSLTDYIYALSTNERTATGTIPGATGLKQSFTPAIINQFASKGGGSDISAALSEESATTKQLTQEAEDWWADNSALAKKDPQKADAEFADLEQNNPELADRVYKISEDQSLGLTKEDRQIKSLGVKNGNRARYIYSQIIKLDTPAEQDAYIQSLDDKGIISDTVFDQIQEMVSADKPLYPEGQKTSETGIINTIFTYAKAIGTDPVTAFNRIFTGQKIRRLDNGAIIVERLPLAESEAIKRAGNGANPTMKLDHTVPLELGGSNSKDNLKLVTTEEWESYTPVENYLGKELRAGRMTKKEVQDLITRFKNGELSAADIIK